MSNKKGKLGLFMLIALVAGNMAGSGAFLLPADLARIGGISLISLCVTIVGALCLALVFAKMSLLIPKTGGPYVYASAAFGEYMGFQTAYYYWVAVWVGNAAIVIATLGYLDIFVPVLNDPVAKSIATLAIIWSLTIVNIIGIRFAGFVQVITTILKFTPLLIVGVLGWFYFHPEYLTQSFNVTGDSNFGAFSSAIVVTLWLFIGVESACVPSGSVDNPKRNIPLATLIGTGIAAVIYFLSSAAIMGMIPNEVLANSTSPFALATEVIFGTWGKLFVAFGALIACLGALNGWILIAAQIPMAAAHDGIFSKAFTKCNSNGAPVFGLILTSIFISILVLATNTLNLIEQFHLFILAATVGEVVAYFYTAVAEMIVLPKKEWNRKSMFHMAVAILATIYSFFTILSASNEVLFYLTAFLLFTIPLYAAFHWHRKRG